MGAVVVLLFFPQTKGKKREPKGRRSVTFLNHHLITSTKVFYSRSVECHGVPVGEVRLSVLIEGTDA